MSVYTVVLCITSRIHDFGRYFTIVQWQPTQDAARRITDCIIELPRLPANSAGAIHCVAVFDHFTIFENVQRNIPKEVVNFAEVERPRVKARLGIRDIKLAVPTVSISNHSGFTLNSRMFDQTLRGGS
jgi:hypothetical protein